MPTVRMGFFMNVFRIRAGMKPPVPIATIRSGSNPEAAMLPARERTVSWMSA
jgi:hypothetical protein